MSLDLTTITPPSSHKPKKQGSLALRLGVVGLVGLITLGLVAAYQSGYRVSQLWETAPKSLEIVRVDRGNIAVYVLENGTVESASNTKLLCQVESLIGTVGGATGTTKGAAAGSAASGAGAQASTGISQGASIKSASSSKKSTASASKKKTSTSQAASSAAAGGSAGGSGGSGSGSGGSGGASGGSSGGSSGTSKSGSSSSSGGETSVAITKKPTIRSFSLTVAAYSTLRTATKSSTTAKSKSGGNRGGGGGGGGGGNRGGGGGGGGGGGNPDEKAGSTRIISLKPEGEEVSAGDVVCELDSAAFRDELLAQRIKVDQARSWMVQAESILEVNQISLAEYKQGIFPQDLQLLRQYLQSCQTEQDRAEKNLVWSKQMVAKGFRASQQYAADLLSTQKTTTTLAEANVMLARLEKFTGPKLIKALEAKLEANRADTLAQKSAYQIELDRMKRLERIVGNCTIRAPRDGIVVYSLPAGNGWRPATPTIMEGATVREGQSLIELPDSNDMRVRAKVNETKVGLVHPGQRARLRVDAFPDITLTGTVTEVTAIPAPAAGPGSDVKIYYATIIIDSGGFEGLRAGLSTEVTLLVDDHEAALRLPVQAVRWVDGIPYAALIASPDRSTYTWRRLGVGLMNADFVEVLEGLKLGEDVVANAQGLTRPVAQPLAQTAGSLSSAPKL